MKEEAKLPQARTQQPGRRSRTNTGRSRGEVENHRWCGRRKEFASLVIIDDSQRADEGSKGVAASVLNEVGVDLIQKWFASLKFLST
jgi:hypothetical protein